MTNVQFEGRRLTVDSHVIELSMDILDAFELDGRVIVLGDPDSYLLDPQYRGRPDADIPAFRNLMAYSLDGTLLWEAEFPQDVDYYYEIVSRQPLVAASFSSFVCRIDPATGKIVSAEFVK